MDEYLCRRLQAGKVTLFLGAGASWGSRNKQGQPPPSGERLAELLAEAAGLNLDPARDTLATVASAARYRLGDLDYHHLLTNHYRHCLPSQEYIALCSYTWPRLYTTNIDDALDGAVSKYSHQDVSIVNRSHPITDPLRGIEELQIIKLNGSVDRLHEGIIFSVEEYAREAGRQGSWYEQLASDYSISTFVFIGSRLNEPLFYHHVERYIDLVGALPGRAYIVCPEFSEIQEEFFKSKNIVIIRGKLVDFVRYLQQNLGKGHLVPDVINCNTPGYIALFEGQPETIKKTVQGQASAITVVSRELLSRAIRPASVGVRDFYFGVQPTWRDILDGVAARLESYGSLQRAVGSGKALIVMHGPAGSGKTTGLMTVSLAVADEREDKSVFFVEKTSCFRDRRLRFFARPRTCAQFSSWTTSNGVRKASAI